jgi:adenylate kinase|tara:strand:+ start:10198 stop:10710 length:513 start_codon:yes stop_codon:yes gene_type:complete
MKVLIVTGSVGTGKTTLSKNLAEKLNFPYLDVNKIIEKYNISEGYDKKRKTKIVHVRKLNKALIKEIKQYSIKIKSNKNIKNGLVIDSHLSHYLPKKYVDLCIITKCNLKQLERRLKKKNYSKAKVRENLDAEIFDVCLNEAKENKHKILVVDTTKGINIEKISNKIGVL